MEKYSDFDGDLNNPIRKIFEELVNKQFIELDYMERQGERKETIEQLEALIKTAKFTKYRKGLYRANINSNTLFVDTNNKFIRYNKGKVKDPLDIENSNTILNLDESIILERREVNIDGKNMLEVLAYFPSPPLFYKLILDKNGTKEFYRLTFYEGQGYYTVENKKDGIKTCILDSSNAKIKERKVNNSNEFTFIKDPEDIYENTSIESIKMNCDKFLKSIEFSCDINGEKKKIIMRVNNKNKKEYYYINNKGNKNKINDIDTINNIEKQIKNFQLSFYDNLYAGYREKYQTNTLPAVQYPIDALFFALNTNYRFEKVFLPEEEKNKALKQADNIINCIKDMKNNNKTTCYIPFDTKTHATLLRIKQYVENGENKYSFTLYNSDNSGGEEYVINPFFNKKNKIAQEVIEILSKKLKIDKKNINMEYKEKFRQRGPTCVMSSAFTAFIKDNVDNLRNKYKQLQLKQNRLNTLNNNIWKQQNNENYKKYKEEKNKMKDELFNLHELSNALLEYYGDDEIPIKYNEIIMIDILKEKIKKFNKDKQETQVLIESILKDFESYLKKKYEELLNSNNKVEFEKLNKSIESNMRNMIRQTNDFIDKMNRKYKKQREEIENRIKRYKIKINLLANREQFKLNNQLLDNISIEKVIMEIIKNYQPMSKVYNGTHERIKNLDNKIENDIKEEEKSINNNIDDSNNFSNDIKKHLSYRDCRDKEDYSSIQNSTNNKFIIQIKNNNNKTLTTLNEKIEKNNSRYNSIGNKIKNTSYENNINLGKRNNSYNNIKRENKSDFEIIC